MTDRRPPRAALSLLRRIVPASHADDLADDIGRAYQKRLGRGWSRLRADVWYLGQVLAPNTIRLAALLKARDRKYRPNTGIKNRMDSLIQDIHFSLTATPWEDLGWKALAVNLSDIAAMGGVPDYALVSLALPGNTEVDDVTALYQGMKELAQPSGVAIIGGDTDSAPLVVITITVLGNTGNRSILTRSTARPGEQVAVTGYLGAAAAGLEMLTRRLELHGNPGHEKQRDR